MNPQPSVRIACELSARVIGRALLDGLGAESPQPEQVREAIRCIVVELESRRKYLANLEGLP